MVRWSRHISERRFHWAISASRSASFDFPGLSHGVSSPVNTFKVSPQLFIPPAQSCVGGAVELTGEQLVGREIIVYWEEESKWFDAIVVRYYENTEEYKLVYRADQSIEIVLLRDQRWVVAPMKLKSLYPVVLEGAIVKFKYPHDGLYYEAMIFEYSENGMTIRVAYLDEHTTDSLEGGGWEFITASPCILDDTTERDDT